MNESKHLPESNPEISDTSEITKDQLIATLREGAEKPAAIEMMQSYLKQEEEKAGDSMELRIISSVKWGLLLIEAGYANEGLSSLEEAQSLASHEEINAPNSELKVIFSDLYWDIQTEIDKTNNS